MAAVSCRWPASDQGAAAICAAAKHVKDWDLFLRVIKRHHVVVLARQSLRATEIKLPPAINEQLDALVQQHVRHGLKLAAETARLQNLLAAAGIPAIVLKGAALEQLAYASIAIKQTRDIDLLVPVECAQLALQIIERVGYALFLPAKNLNQRQRSALVRFGREVELVEPRTKIRVELQWRAADNPVLLSGIDAHAATQTVMLSESAGVRTLAPDNLFAYLCVHGAHHSWSRLKWLADLNALIASTKPDLEHLYRHAKSVGAGLCAGQALLLCQQLFGLRLPDVIARELKAHKRCQRLVAVAIEAMTESNGFAERDQGTRAVMRGLRNQLMLGHGWAFYAAQWRLACAGVADIVRIPLPRPLHFVYPLLRLPLWLWRRARLALAPF